MDIIERAAEERNLCITHMPEFGTSVIRCKRTLAPLGYKITEVAYRLTGPSEFERPGLVMRDYVAEVRELRRQHPPELSMYPRPLAPWGQEAGFSVCSIHEVDELIPHRSAGEFLILTADSAVLIADRCQNIRATIDSRLADERVRHHYPTDIAFRFLFHVPAFEILAGRAAFKEQHPERVIYDRV